LLIDVCQQRGKGQWKSEAAHFSPCASLGQWLRQFVDFVRKIHLQRLNNMARNPGEQG